ncbi:MAG: phosphodiester glycosidase family protein [Patescibacteria group bacterium]|jgi:hypothetical protein
MKQRMLGFIVLGFLLGIVSMPQLSFAASDRIVHSNSSWRKYTDLVTSRGKFTVQVVAVNLQNPKLRIATLTNTKGDCKDNCPVAPLIKYVQRLQGFAGINGTYFCPADYAACRNQDGSYFWMVYNSIHGTFVNQTQNKFNHGPLLAFDTENHWHFWREAKDWPGLAGFEAQYDTRLTALISNGPALVINKQVVVTASELDSKQRTVKSARSAIALKGRNIYFLVGSSATVLDMGAIAAAFNMEYAINLDGGGSSALVFDNQYRVGPGRNIPNAIVLTENPVR